ncbi:metallophosphoesterase [bacterium E08(2017)]|nr:metallophosphoesterase [bacterium E08(2017)]
MKILMVGDIVGSPGRRTFKACVEKLKAEHDVDFVIANAENSAGGRGLTADLAEELLAAGADVLTMGDHVWDQREFRAYLDNAEKVIRPLNMQPGSHGKGYVSVETGFGKVTVINLIGRVFMREYDCPFRAVDKLLEEIDPGNIVVVDIHAEATSEKIMMGRYLDGRASLVAGTHTHVQTSDETVLPGGTAYITDLGMTGPKDGSLGRDLEQVKNIFLTGLPSMFKVAKGDTVLEGVVADIDRETGRSNSITRVREVMKAD